MKSAWSRYFAWSCSGDVHDRAAHAALAQQRRGEHEHHRLLAERVGEVDLVQLVVRAVRGCRSRRGCRPRPPRSACGSRAGSHPPPARGRPSSSTTTSCGRRRGRRHEAVVEPRHAQHLVLAGLLERHLRDVQGLCRVRVVLARSRSGTPASPRATGSARRTAPAPGRRPRARCRPLRWRRRSARVAVVNNPNPRRFLPATKSEPVGASTGPPGGRELAQLGERLPLGARELVRPRLGRRLAGLVVVTAAPAAAGHERAGEQNGSDGASAAHVAAKTRRRSSGPHAHRGHP